MGLVTPLHVIEPVGRQLPGGDGPEGELPLHMWVPTSGSSLHFPPMQINWPSQSFKVLHGPLHEEMADPGEGKDKMLSEIKKESMTNFAMVTEVKDG